MLSKLTSFDKKLISSNILLNIITYIFGTIFNFFIWEKTNDIKFLIYYYLFYNLSIFIFYFVGEFLITKIYSKWLRIIGILINIPFGVIILNTQEVSLYTIIILAVTLGAALGLRAQPYSVLVRNYVEPVSRGIFNSANSAVGNFVRIILPFILSQIISATDSYNVPFYIAIVLVILSTVPLIFIKNREEYKSKVDFKSALESLKNSVDIKKILILRYFNGFHIAINTVAIGIITLVILGSIGKWGIFSAITTLIQVIVSIVVGTKLKVRNAPIAFSFFSLLYGIGALYFATNFTLIGLIVFNVFIIPFNALFGSSESILRGKVLDLEVYDEKLVDEINVFSELALMLGRNTPLLFMVIFGVSLENEIILKIFLVLLGLVSLAMLSVVGSMSLSKRRNDPFLNA